MTAFRPRVHLNGTSRDELLGQLTDLMSAIRDAEQALGKASPNGRDYYVLGPNALRDAQSKHREWAVALRKIYDEVEAAAEHVSEQETSMIEIAKLQRMVQAEVAADKWWDGLSPKEKRAYIKAHPKSKYAHRTLSTKKSRVEVPKLDHIWRHGDDFSDDTNYQARRAAQQSIVDKREYNKKVAAENRKTSADRRAVKQGILDSAGDLTKAARGLKKLAPEHGQSFLNYYQGVLSKGKGKSLLRNSSGNRILKRDVAKLAPKDFHASLRTALSNSPTWRHNVARSLLGHYSTSRTSDNAKKKELLSSLRAHAEHGGKDAHQTIIDHLMS